MLLAVTCGTLLGEYNFKDLNRSFPVESMASEVNMEPYYDVAMLQTYRNVDPVNARRVDLDFERLFVSGVRTSWTLEGSSSLRRLAWT